LARSCSTPELRPLSVLVKPEKTGEVARLIAQA
jgi:hypothetical protein